MWIFLRFIVVSTELDVHIVTFCAESCTCTEAMSLLQTHHAVRSDMGLHLKHSALEKGSGMFTFDQSSVQLCVVNTIERTLPQTEAS